MKTIKFISALTLILGLAACENYDLPNPPGQSYPQPDGYLTDSDIELGVVDAPINLIELNAANENVKVATIESLKNFPEGYDLTINMEVGNNIEFSKNTTIATTITDNAIYVNPDMLNGAIQEVITKKPGTYNLPARFIAYATRGTTNLRLGGINAYYGDEILNVRTLDADKVIEDSYYLVPCTAAGTPEFAKAVKMNNTAGDNVSGYDNPEFALQIEVPETEDYYFVIAPESAVEAKDANEVYGVNMSTDGTSGKLSTSYPALNMPLKGSVLATINMEQDSFTLTYAFNVLYPVSGSAAATSVMPLYTENFINFYGVTAINQRWQLYTQADKKGIKFSVNSEVEPIVSEDGFEQEGEIMVTTGSASITAPVKGNTLYYIDLNLVKYTYTMKALTTLGVVGNANGWNEVDNVKLTASKDLKTWTATDVEIDGDFKINANEAWEYDFGGVPVVTTTGELVYTLQFKGSNMNAPKGKYDVKIDFSTANYTLTLIKK